jgi:uncharacterized protein (DUF934 family)
MVGAIENERYDRDLCSYVRRVGKFRNLYDHNDDWFFLFAWYWLIVRRGSIFTLAQFIRTDRAVERPTHRLAVWITESEDLKALIAYFENTIKYSKTDRL